MVWSRPGVYYTPSAEELVGSIVLNGPLDLVVREVIEPLEKEGSEVDPQPEFSPEPLFALGRDAFKAKEYHIVEGLPRDDVGQLPQRMSG